MPFPPPLPLDVRFWAKVRRGGPDECWEWTGCRGRTGYGQTGLRGKHLLAHRVSWGLHNGPIPAGMFVCHRCDNPPCVNPAHLFLGTSKDNVADMHAKGREARGERSGRARLTDDLVREFRRRVAGGETTVALAREFGVSQFAVWSAASGFRWKHVQ